MKNKKILLWILAFLPMLITLIALPTLPNIIPAHFGFDGSADRWGSKYELLILPIITPIFIAIMAAIGNYAKKQKNSTAQNEKVLNVVNYIIAIIYNAMTCYFLYVSFSGLDNLHKTDIDGMRVLGIVLSVSFIFLGNILPKCKQNALIGIRTKWTLANKTVWYKTHRLGGVIMACFGAVSAILCLTVLSGMSAIFFVSIGMMIITIPIIIYSFVIYKKEVLNEKDI
ncbi:MAG: SdpI family protein [Oscillospiraceae bacterium]